MLSCQFILHSISVRALVWYNLWIPEFFFIFAAVADVLVDAALVLGGDVTLRILYMKLIEVCIDLFDAGEIISQINK